MSSRSMFTAAIEDHLALKKQNAALDRDMPIDSFDVGDPLDRYPGGPVRPVTEEVPAAAQPAMAMAAAGPAEEMRRPLEPLNGMVTTLSLVEDLDEEPADEPIAALSEPQLETQVLRFPGGVGTDRDTDEMPAVSTGFSAPPLLAEDELAPRADEPVIVIDTAEPLAPDAPPAIYEPADNKRRRPTFFGFRRNKRSSEDSAGSGWFSDEPRDFDWGDSNR